MSHPVVFSGEENNTKRVVVRLSPSVLRDLKKILDDEGDSVSAYLRRCAVEKIKEMRRNEY